MLLSYATGQHTLMVLRVLRLGKWLESMSQKPNAKGCPVVSQAAPVVQQLRQLPLPQHLIIVTELLSIILSETRQS